MIPKLVLSKEDSGFVSISMVDPSTELDPSQLTELDPSQPIIIWVHHSHIIEFYTATNPPKARIATWISITGRHSFGIADTVDEIFSKIVTAKAAETTLAGRVMLQFAQSSTILKPM